MNLEYIDENLDKILQNPDSVLYLKPYNVGKKKALFAIVKEDDIYKKVQITKEQSELTFSFEPIHWFYKGPGYLFLKDFICFDNYVALNPTNLEGFKSVELDDDKIFNTGIFATFNDRTATFVKRKTKKGFENEGGIDYYIDLLKQYKEYNPQDVPHHVLDNYIGRGNIIVVPELLDPVALKSDYQVSFYKDEDGKIIDNEMVPLSSVRKSIKKFGRKKDK